MRIPRERGKLVRRLILVKIKVWVATKEVEVEGCRLILEIFSC